MAALAALPSERRPPLDIVGTGPLEEGLRETARRLQLGAVRFLGYRSPEWIAGDGPAYLAFVAPYRVAADGDRDASPTVVKEAMAMGLPVVASRLMGLAEIVSAETGFFVEPGDPSALAQALLRVGELTSDERRAMGRRGRARVVERFSASGAARLLSAAVEACRTHRTGKSSSTPSPPSSPRRGRENEPQGGVAAYRHRAGR